MLSLIWNSARRPSLAISEWISTATSPLRSEFAEGLIATWKWGRLELLYDDLSAWLVILNVVCSRMGTFSVGNCACVYGAIESCPRAAACSCA